MDKRQELVERIEREFGICKIHISRIDEALRMNRSDIWFAVWLN